MEDCLFCKIIDKKIPAGIVLETDELLAFNDISPQAPVHILIVPKTHINSLESITNDNFAITGKMVLTAAKLAKELNLEGYRLVFNCNEIAGQTVFHLHCHLLGGRRMTWPPG